MSLQQPWNPYIVWILFSTWVLHISPLAYSVLATQAPLFFLDCITPSSTSGLCTWYFLSLECPFQKLPSQCPNLPYEKHNPSPTIYPVHPTISHNLPSTILLTLVWLSTQHLLSIDMLYSMLLIFYFSTNHPLQSKKM